MAPVRKMRVVQAWLGKRQVLAQQRSANETGQTTSKGAPRFARHGI